MLKKKLGINAIERDWSWNRELTCRFKIPSTLIISEGCVRIGISAFEWCKKLGEVIIPESVDVIGTLAFAYCDNATIILKRYTEDFKFIGNCAFYYTKDVKEKTRN